MKAWLYALLYENGCSWHVSLDMRADRVHWTRQFGKAFKLRVMEPSLSFGQACELAQHLKTEGSAASERQMLPLLVQTARARGIAINSNTAWKLWEWTPQSIAGENVARTAIESTTADLLAGRALLLDEFKALMIHEGLNEIAENPQYFLQLTSLQGKLTLEGGIHVRRNVRRFPMLFQKQTICRCRRCGNEQVRADGGAQGGLEGIAWTMCPACGGPCPYCEACLTMGRSRYCSPLISGVEEASPYRSSNHRIEDWKTYLAPWGLSDVQAEASGAALKFLKANQFLFRQKEHHAPKSQFLIWAVTGAGKTEMIFPMIQYTLDHGGRVAVTTPRRDVVLELRPRLEKAFPQTSVITLYGGSEHRWERGELTIATTHQLMRFRDAFDLVIVDEIDAYPYHNNPMLQYAANQVCKPGGSYILLSATPPEALQRAAKRQLLPHARVAARYHRQPLPVPEFISIPPTHQMLRQSKLQSKLLQKLHISIKRGAQIFVFVPKIALVEPLLSLLRKHFSNITIDGTSSKDEHRADKVKDFRAGTIRMLITTTILERGVTIPKSDVFILESDSSMFDAAALVQMAGRAGRSAQDPRGFVYFAAREKNRAQVNAVRQIKEMNALARKRGHIDN